MLDDVFAVLSTTPEKLRRELGAMSARQMKRRPKPGKWSAQIILAHLADLEQFYMRDRVRVMLENDTPRLVHFDQEARARKLRYERWNPRKTMALFARRRRENLERLRRLRPADLRRAGVNRTVGKVTLGELLHEWAFHDLGQLRQILELRRYVIFPRMGNMRKFYRLR